MNRRVIVSLLLAQALSLGVAPADAQTRGASGIAGSYEGRYQCGEWNRSSLQVRDLGGGNVSAVFTFTLPPRLGGGQGSFSMTGHYDERTGRLQLTPQQWMHRPRGYNLFGLDGLF